MDAAVGIREGIHHSYRSVFSSGRPLAKSLAAVASVERGSTQALGNEVEQELHRIYKAKLNWTDKIDLFFHLSGRDVVSAK